MKSIINCYKRIELLPSLSCQTEEITKGIFVEYLLEVLVFGSENLSIFVRLSKSYGKSGYFLNINA